MKLYQVFHKTRPMRKQSFSSSLCFISSCLSRLSWAGISLSNMQCTDFIFKKVCKDLHSDMFEFQWMHQQKEFSAADSPHGDQVRAIIFISYVQWTRAEKMRCEMISAVWQQIKHLITCSMMFSLSWLMRTWGHTGVMQENRVLWLILISEENLNIW